MLLPEKKEREYRFRLALRIGLPIFALVIVLLFTTIINNPSAVDAVFYFKAVLIVAFSIYFIFYIIYSGFSEKITESVTNTFSREYLLKYIEKKIKTNKEYTVVLLSIDNIDDINKQYGLQNGDRVLQKVTQWVGEYLENEGMSDIPIGHLKGGDFLLGLEGRKEKFKTMMEMLYLKANELKLEDIEIKVSGAITDTNYSKDLNYLIEHLFELQMIKKQIKNDDESIDPNDLELLVIEAINQRSIVIHYQDVFQKDQSSFREYFIYLKLENGKYLYPKKYKKIMSKLGLVVAFEKMVLEEIFFHHKKYLTQKIALPITPSSLRNDEFLSFLRSLLQEYKGYFEKIVFVLVEHEYYSYTKRFNTIIKSLKNLGVLIAIDRLGSYHTSFLYMRELDVDMVRLDTYYSHREKFAEHQSVIEGFCVMAHQKGCSIWMKNIEDEQVLTQAKKIGIDFVQGKILSELEKL